MSPQNLQVLRPSRKALEPGDVFTMQLQSLAYLFRRVISTMSRWSITPDGGTTNLVYVFEHQSPSKTMLDRSHLQSDQLLIPPQLINRLGWSRGYFETLENLPFGPGEVLPVLLRDTPVPRRTAMVQRARRRTPRTNPTRRHLGRRKLPDPRGRGLQGARHPTGKRLIRQPEPKPSGHAGGARGKARGALRRGESRCHLGRRT